jgi:glucokinase
MNLHRLKAEQIFSKKYINEQHPSFLSVLKLFLYQDANAKTGGRTPLTACFAVAGPVKGNTVKFTNRDSWSIDGDAIARELNIPVVSLVNDFKAVGYGLLTLDEEKECVVLQKGVKDPTAPIACIGAGTGLGECFLAPDSFGQYHCFPCEGGHAEFAPRNDVSSVIFLLLFI